MTQFRQKLHRDLPPSLVWGFDGSTPGPTIYASKERTLEIEWANQLPTRHHLAIDHHLDGAGKDVPEVRTAIHLHGGHVSASSDGYPEDWVCKGQQQKVVYPNHQPAATLWYHDHAMGITRLNAMMGLAGVYILHDPEEDRLKLPRGPYDIPLVLQDRILDAAGNVVYPVSPFRDEPWVPEFFGTNVLVNGRVTPYLEVMPRRYRFRFLNASNSRIFQLSLTPEQKFFQIGSDGGLLREPVEAHEILIAPGERVETVIDFKGREGRRILLVNSGAAPYPAGGAPTASLVMQFRVNWPIDDEADDSRIPDTLSSARRLEERTATRTRRLRLVESMPHDGRSHRVLLDGRRFMDPITEDPSAGSTEIWEFVNTTLDAHPIHLHAVHFQILERYAFNVDLQQRTSEVAMIGDRMQPAGSERGWKDTVLCPPHQVTRIIVPFQAEPGRYVWHCHMLEHEDNEMMRPYLIQP